MRENFRIVVLNLIKKFEIVATSNIVKTVMTNIEKQISFFY